MEFTCYDHRFAFGGSARNSATGSSPLALTELSIIYDLDHPAVRQLINESEGVFRSLQASAKVSTPIDFEELLAKSNTYRSLLRCCVVNLQADIDLSSSRRNDARTHVNNLLDVFTSIELVWSLCEILFIEPAGSSAAEELVRWARWHFRRQDVWLDEITKSATDTDSPSSADSHPKFWDTVYSFVLFGRTEDARELLACHRYRKDLAFINVDELLRKIPFNVKSIVSNQWSVWQSECQRRLTEGHFHRFPELETLVQIMLGNTETISQMTPLLTTWYEMLIPVLMYVHPTVKSFDMSVCVKEAMSMSGISEDSLSPLDEILLSVFNFQVLHVVKELSEHYSNWWFAAHLADLLYHCGSEELSSVSNTVDIREYLLLEYASSLFSHTSLWQTGITYFDHCPNFGSAYLERNLERLDISTDRKAFKVIEICKKRELYEVARGICRERGLVSLKKGNLSSALSWCLQCKDPAFAGYLAEHYLHKYGETGFLHSLHLLDHLGDSMLLSPSLAFLAKYREFYRLYEEKKLKPAADVLAELVRSRVAPKKFWVTLLLDAFDLLKTSDSASTPVIFSSQQTYNLMQILEDLVSDLELLKISHTNESEQNSSLLRDQLQMFRAALVKNLSFAIMAEA